MTKKVLIVDDDPEFRSSTQDILETQGYEVLTAAEGAQGVAKAQTDRPDAIVLDVMMEDAGAGLDSARKLRDEPATAQIPVILLTGVRRADQLLSSYAPNEQWPNVKAAMEKPVDPDFLLKTLKSALEKGIPNNCR